jgi:hypothetical protein
MKGFRVLHLLPLSWIYPDATGSWVRFRAAMLMKRTSASGQNENEAPTPRVDLDDRCSSKADVISISTLHKWRRALEAAGVMFIDPDDEHGPGVRLRGAKGGDQSDGRGNQLLRSPDH